MDIKFKKQFPTRKELEIVSSTRLWKRQDKAARLIQRSFREYIRLKREREREPLDVEDETTQTSSPGGWQGRLSAFLHVHRGSRASSRKSSRASDASDISELGGPWLNLPLLLLSSAANVAPEELDLGRDSNDVSIKITGTTPTNDDDSTTVAATSSSGNTARRRSIYNFPFFLKHQDAVEAHDDKASPPVAKRSGSFKATLHPAAAEDASKPKRGSIIRRRASTKMRRGAHPTPSTVTGADVSILVTEASPEAPAPVPAPSEVVHVLVHRESEEYAMDEDPVELQIPVPAPRRSVPPSPTPSRVSSSPSRVPPTPPSSPPPAECVITIEPDDMDDDEFWRRDRLLDSPQQDS